MKKKDIRRESRDQSPRKPVARKSYYQSTSSECGSNYINVKACSYYSANDNVCHGFEKKISRTPRRKTSSSERVRRPRSEIAGASASEDESVLAKSRERPQAAKKPAGKASTGGRVVRSHAAASGAREKRAPKKTTGEAGGKQMLSHKFPSAARVKGWDEATWFKARLAALRVDPELRRAAECVVDMVITEALRQVNLHGHKSLLSRPTPYHLPFINVPDGVEDKEQKTAKKKSTEEMRKEVDVAAESVVEEVVSQAELKVKQCEYKKRPVSATPYNLTYEKKADSGHGPRGGKVQKTRKKKPTPEMREKMHIAAETLVNEVVSQAELKALEHKVKHLETAKDAEGELEPTKESRRFSYESSSKPDVGKSSRADAKDSEKDGTINDKKSPEKKAELSGAASSRKQQKSAVSRFFENLCSCTSKRPGSDDGGGGGGSRRKNADEETSREAREDKRENENGGARRTGEPSGTRRETPEREKRSSRECQSPIAGASTRRGPRTRDGRDNASTSSGVTCDSDRSSCDVCYHDDQVCGEVRSAGNRSSTHRSCSRKPF